MVRNPCVSPSLLWDLSSCIPSWSQKADMTYTMVKALLLYLLPLVIMATLYFKIIKALWSKNISGKMLAKMLANL